MAKVQRQVASFRNSDGIFDGFRTSLKQTFHFIRRAKIELVRAEPHAVLVFEGFAGLDTQQDFVRLRIFTVYVVAVIRGDKRDGKFAAQFNERLIDDGLFRQAIFHDFKEKILGSEDLPVFSGRLPGGILVSPQEKTGNFAMQTSAQTDQSLMMLLQNLFINPGLIVESLKVAGRGQLHEILVPLHVFNENDQMSGRFTGMMAVFIEPTLRCDIKFAADNGLDPILVGPLIKADGSEHVAVIGHRNGRHLVFPGLFQQIVKADGTVQQAVLRMDVKMNKIGVFHGLLDRLLNRLFQPVVRSFLGDDDIMHMAFSQSR